MTRTIDRNQAIALSLHSWNNTPDDWEALARVVAKLGRNAPPQAKAALAARAARLARLPNPFART